MVGHKFIVVPLGRIKAPTFLGPTDAKTFYSVDSGIDESLGDVVNVGVPGNR